MLKFYLPADRLFCLRLFALQTDKTTRPVLSSLAHLSSDYPCSSTAQPFASLDFISYGIFRAKSSTDVELYRLETRMELVAGNLPIDTTTNALQKTSAGSNGLVDIIYVIQRIFVSSFAWIWNLHTSRYKLAVTNCTTNVKSNVLLYVWSICSAKHNLQPHSKVLLHRIFFVSRLLPSPLTFVNFYSFVAVSREWIRPLPGL